MALNPPGVKANSNIALSTDGERVKIRTMTIPKIGTITRLAKNVRIRKFFDTKTNFIYDTLVCIPILIIGAMRKIKIRILSGVSNKNIVFCLSVLNSCFDNSSVSILSRVFILLPLENLFSRTFAKVQPIEETYNTINGVNNYKFSGTKSCHIL